MKPIANNRLAETDRAWMYWVKNQPWLPHYTKKGIYVAPGGIQKREHELLAVGAIKKEVRLWPRFWQIEKVRTR